MKRIFSFLLAAVLLCGLLAGGTLAADKALKNRTIAIVFDNSGSMYGSGNTRWCCATYAIEVFASMLNEGDKLLVYPMVEVESGGKRYDYNNPLTITSPEQASQIRDIYTDEPGNTHIEAVFKAYEGAKNASGEKWLIVVTDGEEFYENDGPLGQGAPTQKRLSDEFSKFVNNVNVMYLGVCTSKNYVPKADSTNGNLYYADVAPKGADVPGKLTEMCNIIFGRDTLPANHISGSSISFDVSISKMIVFVQGEDISGLTVTGGGTKAGEQSVRYSEKGCANDAYGRAQFGVDKSLQGMIVTYTDCPIGTYNINFSGTKSSVEVYYEPDVDIVPSVTDKEGNQVDISSGNLNAGDYTVEFAMIDNVTKQSTDSDLLGNPVYSATKTVNGQPETLPEQTGSACSVPISLQADDKLEISVTANYLSGFSITKTNEDFGWPDPISVVLPPPKELKLNISGGSGEYFLTTLEEGEPFRAELTYDGQKLTGKELEAADLKWDPALSGAMLYKVFQDDHYDIVLRYQDENNPMATQCGPFEVPIYAEYTPENCATATAESKLAYTLTDNNLGLAVSMELPTDYFVISELDEANPIKVKVSLMGAPVSDAQLEQMQLSYDTGGINCTPSILPGQSAFALELEPTDGVKSGKYKISASVTAQDELGRTETQTAEEKIELQPFSKIIKILLILLIIALVVFANILFWSAKTMPKNITFDPDDSKFTIAGNRGSPVDSDCLYYDRRSRTLTVKAPSSYQYPLISCSTTLRLKPLSPRIKPSPKRKVLVESVDGVPMGVKKLDIGGIEYTNNPKTGLEKDGPDPVLSNLLGVEVNGTASSGVGSPKKAHLDITLVFE